MKIRRREAHLVIQFIISIMRSIKIILYSIHRIKMIEKNFLKINFKTNIFIFNKILQKIYYFLNYKILERITFKL